MAQVTRKDMTATNFYFSRLFEARPSAFGPEKLSKREAKPVAS